MNDSKGLVEFLTARLNETPYQPAGTTGAIPAARYNADLDAKRRIVASFAASENALTSRDAEGAVVRMVLRLLAEPYADHSDYRPEWSTKRPLNHRPHDGNTL